MVRRRRFSIRPRWAMAAGAVIAAGGVLAGTVLASAAAPVLPRQTPAQLIASLRHARMPAAFSATLTETASLGFPSLPAIGGMSSSPLSPASLLSGSHTIQVWSAGPRHLRIALPVSFGETDLRVNGSQVWLWESQGQKATRFIAPGPAACRGHYMMGNPGMNGQGTKRERAGSTDAPGPDWAKLSPLQAARKALALAGPTTRVTIPGTTSVAGRNAYLLAIAPRTTQSLVGRILIAIDAKTRLPLRVQVFARGSASPALAIGFTSLTFARPAMSNFTFTPPPGAHVKTVRPRVAQVPPAGMHSGWSGVPPAGVRKPKAGLHNGWSGQPPLPPAALRGPMAGVRTFGQGWLSVVAFPARVAALPPMLGGPAASGWAWHAGPARNSRPAHVGSQAYGSSLTISGPAGNGLSILTALLKAAKPVNGPWGHGRLLRTSLVSVLITSKGVVLAGAVTPAVLFADAAKVK
jgi:hypothetical protein